MSTDSIGVLVDTGWRSPMRRPATDDGQGLTEEAPAQHRDTGACIPRSPRLGCDRGRAGSGSGTARRGRTDAAALASPGLALALLPVWRAVPLRLPRLETAAFLPVT